MKVLIAAGMFPPDIGGPATYTKLLAERLPAVTGTSVAVETFGAVRHLPKLIRHIAYAGRLIWRGRDADIIFAQDTVSVGLPALVAASILGKIFLVRVPGDYAWEQSVQRFGVTDGIDDFQTKRYGWQVEALRRIQKLVVGSADMAIAPSRYFAALVSGWVTDPSRVAHIYNGIDLSEASQVAAAGKGKLNRREIVSAGRLVPWKGFDMIIRAMKKLPDWKLAIAGDGPDMKRLADLVASEGVSSQVSLLGAIDKKALLGTIASAEVFALNTSFESFSFLVVEAMAVGTPVIATRIGNLAEIVDDGVNGILIEPDNEPQFLAALRRVTASDAARQALSVAALEKARAFSIEATVTAVQSIALKLMAEPSPRRKKREFAAKLVRYLFSGGTAAVTDLILLYLFTSVAHVWYVVSSALAFIVAFMVSFVLQKFFTFQDHAMDGVRSQAFIYLIVTGANLLLNTALIYLLVEYTGINYILAQIITSIAIAVESFMIYSAFIFKKQSPRRLHATSS